MSFTFFCILLFVLLALGIMFYNIYMEVYTCFDRYGWEKNAKPAKEAPIQNITSQQIQYTRNKAKLKTKISFSDGFYFVTYKTDRDYGILTYKIFISDETRKKIIGLALEKHKLSVDRFTTQNN